MKYPKHQLQTLEYAFRKFIAHHGHTPEEIREDYQSRPLAAAYDIYRHVTYDLTCPDTHPAFSEFGRKRIIQYNPTFELYPRGINDSHIATAIKHIARKLDIYRPTKTGV